MGIPVFSAESFFTDSCTINDKNAYSEFSAYLKEFSPVSGGVSLEFSEALSASELYLIRQNLGVGGIKAVFYVSGTCKDTCYINSVNLVSECKSCVIKLSEERFEYVAALSGYSITETGVNFYNEVSLIFSAVKRRPLVKRVFLGRGTIQNPGVVPSGACITVIPNRTLSEVTVNGIQIKNLQSRIPFTIDGLTGEVKSNGVNRFLDTDLIEFPKMNPGENLIEASDESCSVEVSYYPTFIL